MNISVLYAHPGYRGFAVVIISQAQSERKQRNDVYVFNRKLFNSLRKHIFLSDIEETSLRILQENALAHGEIQFPNQPITLENESGQKIISFTIENIREGTIEILFYNITNPKERDRVIINVIIMTFCYLIIAGSLVGINDYTQRVVFHETRGFSYLFKSIGRSFTRSFIISLFFSVIIGAVAANIYFYIFIMSADISVFIAAINFWMLVFFLFILLWVFPLSVMNRDDSIWKAMKKSLFVSFDNFTFTLRALLLLLFMGILSAVTLSIFPGFAGAFSFLNTALKELSSRYNKP
jgi:hypothetical protein